MGLHSRGPQNVEMIVAECDAHGTRSRGNGLRQMKALFAALKYGYILRSKIDDGNEIVLRFDAPGISADAALPLRGERLQKFAPWVVNQKLICCGIGCGYDAPLVIVICVDTRDRCQDGHKNCK